MDQMVSEAEKISKELGKLDGLSGDEDDEFNDKCESDYDDDGDDNDSLW